MSTGAEWNADDDDDSAEEVAEMVKFADALSEQLHDVVQLAVSTARTLATAAHEADVAGAAGLTSTEDMARDIDRLGALTAAMDVFNATWPPGYTDERGNRVDWRLDVDGEHLGLAQLDGDGSRCPNGSVPFGERHEYGCPLAEPAAAGPEPEPEHEPAAETEQGRACYNCGGTGHLTRDCPN